MRAGQRLGDRRVVADEGRLQQVRLDELAEQLDDHLLRAPQGVVLHLEQLGDGAQPVQRGVRGDLVADPLRQAGVDAEPLPLAVEVDDTLVGLDLAGADDVGGVEDDPLDQPGDGGLVAPGLVRLEHGELRRVRGVDALVAEHPAQLVDLLRPADHHSLEVELQRDPQAHGDVEGVQVGAERPGRRPAVHQLQGRGLDLEVAVGVQALADRAGDRRAGPQNVLRLRADHQVGVALPDPGLLGQFVVQGRHRAQRLGGHLPAVRHHRQLAAPRPDHPAVHEHPVTQVDVGLPGGQRLLADLRLRQHHLQPRRVVLGGEAALQGGEAQLAGVAQEHHPAADPDQVLGLLTGLQVLPAPADLVQGVRTLQPDRVGRTALLEQSRALLEAHLHLLGHLVVGKLGGRILLSTHRDMLSTPAPAGHFRGLPHATRRYVSARTCHAAVNGARRQPSAPTGVA
ncbi:hypothetical protein SDC9_101811 [bioreactor metagenome]|uniref:Uncharacterized protein n=1 Tax=bioreactor metagenome TaxID=1076179 RepID=A0A645AQ47_9ZZZZ